MIDPDYIVAMAKYNRWQNASLYQAADGLSDAERRADRGAFFKSIHGTFSHILWGDQIWMSRFAGTEAPGKGIPESDMLVTNWEALQAARSEFDAVIVAWADDVDAGWLEQELTWYSGAAKREVTAPLSLLVTHMFNHQTHHRGQIHAMLTAAGAKPEDTDLMLLAFQA